MTNRPTLVLAPLTAATGIILANDVLLGVAAMFALALTNAALFIVTSTK